MNVIGVNTSGKLKPGFDSMFSLDKKDYVLRQSDFVLLLLPLTDKTYHLFGKKEFECMKPDAYFINLGRGPLVKIDELIHCIQQGRIRGAALDVFDQEPLEPGDPLWEQENILITPHIAARTEKYYERSTEKFLLNYEAYLNKKEPPYYINLDKQY